ncbi:MAG: 2-isopropylmalate synthase [Christensenellales bacterium]
MAEKIRIFDTTLRDGEQTPGVNLNMDEKLEIARHLETLGVDVIEAGFPASSPGDFEAVRRIAQQIRQSAVCGLARAVTADVERCYLAVKEAAHPVIHVFIATSELHMQYKLRMTAEQVLARAVEAVRLAKHYVQDVEFSCEDGSRTDPAFLYRILEAVIDAGATVVNIPDTVGYCAASEYRQLIQGVMDNVPNIHKAIVSVHCHDDLGLGVANSLAGLVGGARQVECTINGLGERAGNAALEEIVMNLYTRGDHYGLTCGVDTTQLYRTCRMISSLTNVELPANKAVVGMNAFRHESGIHQHGMLANRQTYEIMTPASIGLSENAMVMGKHSGRHAFQDRLGQLGYNLTATQLDKAFEKFKDLADRKKEITDRDLEAIVGAKMTEAEKMYELESFQLQSGNKIKAIASVTLLHQGGEYLEAAVGDGPVDAAFKAIDRVVGREITLVSYGLRAVTEGKDALGEVTVRVSYQGDNYIGKGLSTDVIEASIRAYVNAINRALS